TAVLQRWPLHDLTVTTATANAPALALYARFGFRPLRMGRMGTAGLPVVQLLRRATAPTVGGASDPA
ncbi:MAG: hypothetical protein ABIN96_03670, partial [Rubrivivax sp.]